MNVLDTLQKKNGFSVHNSILDICTPGSKNQFKDDVEDHLYHLAFEKSNIENFKIQYLSYQKKWCLHH